MWGSWRLQALTPSISGFPVASSTHPGQFGSPGSSWCSPEKTPSAKECHNLSSFVPRPAHSGMLGMTFLFPHFILWVLHHLHTSLGNRSSQRGCV